MLTLCFKQPPKKGISIEEKQSRLLAWFQNMHTMYNIKEIETIASKKTGISSMQIKDILKMLVDDGLVNCEKCGISNIYWSFKFTSIMKINNDYEKATKKKEEILQLIISAKKEIKELKKERQLSVAKRNKLSDEINQLIDQNNKFQNEIDTILANTPEKINDRLSKLSNAQIAIDTMTDNINILVNFIIDSNPTGMSKSQICEYFGIPDDI
jgi:DNA repair ATPase RecN